MASHAAEIVFAEQVFPELEMLLRASAEGGTESQLIELRMEERRGALDVVRGQRRPQVRASARLTGVYEMRSDIDDRTRGTVNANVTLSQPLYHWGNLERRESVAEDRVRLEGIESNRRSARHFMNVRSAYLNWLLMREKKTILEQSIALSESFVDVRRQLIDVGQASEQDVLEMEASLLENHEALSHLEKNIQARESALRRLVGPSLDLERLGSTSLSQIQPMEEIQLQELANRLRGRSPSADNPDVQLYAMLEQIESEQLEILEKEDHPKLDLVAGVFSDYLEEVNNNDIIPRIQYFAGLQVNWSIFDGWQTEGYKRSALARKRAFSLRESYARAGVEQQMEALLADIQLNLKQVEARAKRADLLERRQRLVRDQVDSGFLPGSERIEVDIDYLNTRQRLMEARVHYLLNLMELGLLAGEDPARVYYAAQADETLD